MTPPSAGGAGESPCAGPTQTPWGGFLTLRIDPASGVDAVELPWYFPAGTPQPPAEPSRLALMWFDPAAGTWRRVQPQAVVIAPTNGWGGYVEVRLDATSSPPLGQLTGTIFGAGVPNQPPVAQAGPDRYGAVASPVRLSGAASRDPDAGDSVTSYRWRLVAKPAGSGAELDRESGDADATFVPDKAGRYELQPVVKDSFAWASQPDTVVVEVLATYAAPNPARAAVTFHHDAGLAGGTVRIYDVAGRLVRVRPFDASGETAWDLTDESGRPVASGLYLWLLLDREGKLVFTRSGWWCNASQLPARLRAGTTASLRAARPVGRARGARPAGSPVRRVSPARCPGRQSGIAFGKGDGIAHDGESKPWGMEPMTSHRKLKLAKVVAFGTVVTLATTVGFAVPSRAAGDDRYAGTGAIFAIGAGARPLALGDAFLGIADDESALFYNPAGLGYLGRAGLTSLYSTQYDVITYAALGLAVKGFGVGVLYLDSGGIPGAGTDRSILGPFSYSSVAALAGSGVGVGPVALGVRGKFLSVTSATLEGAQGNESITGVQGTGYDADLGVLVNLGIVRLGAAYENVLGRAMRYDTGSNEAFERRLTVGTSLKAGPLLLAADFGNLTAARREYRAGVEINLAVLAVRAGVSGQLGDGSGAEAAGASAPAAEGRDLSAGAGVRLGGLQVDYAYLLPAALPATHRVSLTLCF